MLIWSKKATGRSIIRFAGRPEQLYASQRQCTADSRISGPVDEIYRAEYCNLPASRTTTIVYGEIMFNRQLISIALFIFLISVHGAFGASISITPSGNGNFIIQGNSMDGVSGIDLSIVYDKSSLASPSVSQGSLLSGAMMAANTNNPGAIRIVIISSKAFSGSGQVATISFATYAGNGSISVASTMINSKGAPVSGGGTVVAADFQTSSGSSGFYSTPGIPFSPPNSGDTTTTTTTTSTPSSSGVTTPRALGTVSMPGDAKPGGDAKPADAGVVSERVTNPEAAKSGEPHPAEEKTVAEPQAPVKVTSTSYPGALENFRAYKGEKSPAVLIDLLKKDIAPAIRQDPAFVLSDGKTKVKILAETSIAKSPKFMLSGAELVSLIKDDTSGTWIIEALPNAGVLQATLTILTDSAIVDYPLTLAPPIAGISPVEADFALFLKDSGAAKPKRDLNGDGRHDYLDDFIYTVNYLLVKESVGKANK